VKLGVSPCDCYYTPPPKKNLKKIHLNSPLEPRALVRCTNARVHVSLSGFRWTVTPKRVHAQKSGLYVPQIRGRRRYTIYIYIYEYDYQTGHPSGDLTGCDAISSVGAQQETIGLLYVSVSRLSVCVCRSLWVDNWP